MILLPVLRSRRSVLAGLAALSFSTSPACALPEPKTQGMRRRYIDGRFGQIHAREASPLNIEPSQPPLVLLHQSPLSGRMFDQFMPLLAKDRLVIALDTPGYGESDRPEARPSADDYADSIVEALSGVYQVPFDMLGYHTGAALAVIAAARHPGNIRRLVLIAMPYFAAERRNEILQQVLTEKTYAADGSHLPPLWTGTYGVKPPGQSDDDVARIVAEKQRPGLHGGWALHSILERDLTPDLQSVRQKTLALAPHDSLQGATKAAADLIEQCKFVDLPDLAYGLFDAAQEELATPINAFLAAA